MNADALDGQRRAGWARALQAEARLRLVLGAMRCAGPEVDLLLGEYLGWLDHQMLPEDQPLPPAARGALQAEYERAKYAGFVAFTEGAWYGGSAEDARANDAWHIGRRNALDEQRGWRYTRTDLPPHQWEHEQGRRVWPGDDGEPPATA